MHSSSVIIRLPTHHSSIVALRSITDRRVVAHGQKIETVIAKAKKAGVPAPVVVFVPNSDQNTIY